MSYTQYAQDSGDIDARQHAPAAARNRQPLLEVLRAHLPPSGTVLEVAAGTGEHAVYFAEHLPQLTWQPSDPDPAARASIAAWARAASLANLRPPLALDAAQHPWPLERADAVVCINMIHISPYAATEGLMRGAGGALPPGGVLVTYGPYKVGGAHTAPSNEAFDASLRARNSAWGVRDVAQVAATAAQHGLELVAQVDMPANNLSLVWRKQ